MVDTFDEVQYVPGGATLNAIKVAQVVYKIAFLGRSYCFFPLTWIVSL